MRMDLDAFRCLHDAPLVRNKGEQSESASFEREAIRCANLGNSESLVDAPEVHPKGVGVGCPFGAPVLASTLGSATRPGSW